eukprot:2939462-Amphidinium_carterae.1
MAARLRQAWTSVNSTSLEGAAAQKRGHEQDHLDVLLLEAIIMDLRKAFWSRCKVVFSTFENLDKHLLQEHPVFKFRALTQQLRSERKKQRVTEGV